MTRKLKVLPAVMLLGGAMLAGGCDGVGGTGPSSRFDPRRLTAVYSWVLVEWDAGVAKGFPMVQLEWELPTNYRDEPFRIYARDAQRGSYGLIATVTSCQGGVCRYDDTNVRPGEIYDYYVATLDERGSQELGVSNAVRVDVPRFPNLAAPAAPRATSLDGAAFLEWTATGAERYIVLASAEGGTTFVIGETDGTSFFDDRAENGARYLYYLAAMDGEGHVSSLSQGAQAIPRPDFHADIVYADVHLLSASGFRFVSDETQDPIVPGNSSSAQWRLTIVNGDLRIQPMGQTSITSGTFTTALTCGPGSDATCVDVRVAPASSAFGPGSVRVETGFTYVLRVIGSDNRVHFAKLRVQGSSADSQGRRLIVFDWAYQMRAEEPSLNRRNGDGN